MFVPFNVYQVFERIVESRFVSLRVYLRTRGQYTCTYPLYIRVCNLEQTSAVIAAVASFHSGDPDQVVPVVLYTVVLYTLTLHARNKRTSLSPSPISPV